MAQSPGSQPTLREWSTAVIVNHMSFSDGDYSGGRVLACGSVGLGVMGTLMGGPDRGLCFNNGKVW